MNLKMSNKNGSSMEAGASGNNAAEQYRLWQATQLLRSFVVKGFLVELPDGTFILADDAAALGKGEEE